MEGSNDKHQKRCFLIFLDGDPYLTDHSSESADVAIWKERQDFEYAGVRVPFERFSALEVINGSINAKELQDMLHNIRERKARHRKKVVISLIVGSAWIVATCIIAYLWARS